jgi:hypothetical protein
MKVRAFDVESRVKGRRDPLRFRSVVIFCLRTKTHRVICLFNYMRI